MQEKQHEPEWEKKHRKNIWGNDAVVYYCPLCGFGVTRITSYNYCPRCGGKVRNPNDSR